MDEVSSCSNAMTACLCFPSQQIFTVIISTNSSFSRISFLPSCSPQTALVHIPVILILMTIQCPFHCLHLTWCLSHIWHSNHFFLPEIIFILLETLYLLIFLPPLLLPLLQDSKFWSLPGFILGFSSFLNTLSFQVISSSPQSFKHHLCFLFVCFVFTFLPLLETLKKKY